LANTWNLKSVNCARTLRIAIATRAKTAIAAAAAVSVDNGHARPILRSSANCSDPTPMISKTRPMPSIGALPVGSIVVGT